MKLVHFSDPHAGGAAEDWLAYIDKRWVGVFNYRFRRRFRHDLSLLSRAVEFTLRERPDVAVCTGDLTSTGQPGEFARVLAILQPLRDSGIPLLYLPGNHDCYVRRDSCVRAVRNAVHELSRGDYEFDNLPIVRRYGECDFVLLNTSRPSNLLCSWGFVSKKDLAEVSRICALPKHGPRILLSHYPMIEHHPWLRTRHRLFGQQPILNLMQSGAIDLSLCGHVHKPYRETDDSGRGENCAGSVTRNGTLSVVEYHPATDRFDFRVVDLKQAAEQTL